MSESALDLGPVSRAVEADLRNWVRRHGIVVWLDGDGHYGELVRRLRDARQADRLPYDLVPFEGSHLELVFALEPFTGGVDKRPLAIHLPGFNEQDVRDTPLLETYLAGARYRKALDTAITEAAAGQVAPEDIEAFQRTRPQTLAQADAWLAGRLTRRDGDDGFRLPTLPLPALLDDLLRGGPVSTHLDQPGALESLWEALGAMAGLPATWRDRLLTTRSAGPRDVAFVVAGWALAVEYVDDLTRPPVSADLQPAKDLPAAVVQACRELAERLRGTHAPFYTRTADEVEALLEDEVVHARAEDLGHVDTFRFEERKVLQAALVALEHRDWDTAATWADARLDGGSFWVRREVERNSAWRLIRATAALGQAVATAGASLGARDLADAATRYADRGAGVDGCHRHMEQLREALLYPLLPEYARLRACLDAAREVWRGWADGWARDFAELCRCEGFLPPPEIQQRTLFDDVVRPLTQDPGTTAYFLVDALRYEMARELLDSMGTLSAASATLTPRLAELPTVTEVGMNVLAPVSEGGRLRPAFESGKVQGFSAGEFRVRDPDSRRRAMHERVGGGTCPLLTLAEVVGRDSASLKQAVARAKLVVVWSEEIDQAGESGAGPAVFEKAIQKLVAAWRLLRDAGVRRFVITADHGFLLLGDGTPVVQAHGRKVDPKRRHVFSTVGADHSGEQRVPVPDLRYDGVEDWHLMLPETTARFDTGDRTKSFAHGGNSLQERVIPVLTVVHRAAAGGATVRYRVTAQAREGVADIHCLAGSVEVADQAVLDFGGSRDLDLAFEALESNGATVEVVQVRGGARIGRGGVVATVGQAFEVFFRLVGPAEARALVQIDHPSALADVEPCVVEERFAVSVVRAPAASSSKPVDEVPGSRGWLDKLPAGPRALFEHLAAHGTVTEAEAMTILGGARAARSFARQLEAYARVVPFDVRVQVVGGVKRYVREGSES